MTDRPLSVMEYIKQHDDKRYCESLVFPNGKIMDAIPSHSPYKSVRKDNGRIKRNLSITCFSITLAF